MYSFYEFLADFLVVIHLAYMAYAVLGQLLILVGWPLGWQWIRNPWFRLSHLAMILIVAVEAVVQFECPLTTWERDLRVHIGQVKVISDDGDWELENESFTARVARKIMFAGSEEAFLPFLKPTYYTFAAIVLASIILVPPRFRRRAAPTPQPPAATNERVGPVSSA